VHVSRLTLSSNGELPLLHPQSFSVFPAAATAAVACRKGEIMVATNLFGAHGRPATLSRITLAFMQDSGWYDVNWGEVGELLYISGCGFWIWLKVAVRRVDRQLHGCHEG
jgi:hypothetical protein